MNTVAIRGGYQLETIRIGCGWLPIGILLIMSGGCIYAQVPLVSGSPIDQAPVQTAPKPPASPAALSSPYKLLRYDEDWRPRRDSNGVGVQDSWSRAKYIPFGGRNDWYLSVGGEARLRYERTENPLWGELPTDRNGYVLQRYLFHTDLHLGPHLRVFSQLTSGLEHGGVGESPPTNVNRLDLSQCFLDLTLTGHENRSLTLRVGRQEMTYGSARLIGSREPLNVRRGFDGLRLIARQSDWRVDGFLAKPVLTKVGLFDDRADPAQTIWGIYAVRPMSFLPGSNLDLYYLGLDRQNARFDQGTGHERRESVGTRLWGNQGAWDYNAEGLVQWGQFGEEAIRAWGAFAEIGYSLTHAPNFRPRFGLRVERLTGDQDRRVQTLQTFDASYPKGANFLELVLIGPYNYTLLNPILEVKLVGKLRLVADGACYWRTSLNDGIYGVAGNLERSGQASQGRFIGLQTNVTAQWLLTRHITWVGMLSHFSTGPFLRDTGPAQPVSYLTTWISFTF